MFTELEFIASIQRQRALDGEWNRDPLSYIERVGLPPNFTIQAGLAFACDSLPMLLERLRGRGVELGSAAEEELLAAIQVAWIRGVGIGVQMRHDSKENA